MQTFLPFPEFGRSIRCLDKRRALKQTLECKQILDILHYPEQKKGWKNHPAVLMWEGYDVALSIYYQVAYDCCEQQHRIQFNKLKPMPNADFIVAFSLPEDLPPWLGNEEFHLSHRSNLLRKGLETKNEELLRNLEMAGITVDNTDPNLPYVWPVTKDSMNAKNKI